MNMKKWLLAGTCISMLGAFSACSDDSSSPTSTTETESSSSVTGESTDSGTSSSTVVSSSSIADDAEPQMACSEIMYNAPDGSSLEWIEIYIAGGQDMDNMVNYSLHLSGAVDYVFPAEPLTKGEYVVVANDTTLFKTTYPDFSGRLFGPWDNASTVKLPNEGDVVNVKLSGSGDVSCAFSNEPPWPSLADGNGRSLVYKGGNAAQPNSWAASKVEGGVPGVGGDEWVSPATVRINEIMPNVGTDNAWIELYNMGSESVDVAGWNLVVKRRGDTLTIKSGTVSSVIPANGYAVLDAVDNFDEELVVALDGGEFYLVGPEEGEESSIWVPASTGTSGVVDLSDGSTAQGPLATATPGAANSALARGSVYINEIHYHEDANSSIPFEFLELVNDSETDITLYSSSVRRGWKIEGIGLEFSSITFPANSLMLLIPATLEEASISGWGADYVRSAYGIADDVIIQTYSGKLSNRSETIAVKEPYSREEDSTDPTKTNYFYTWHDATLYSDSWSGLEEADGYGFSLHRVDSSTMGYEASAWTAAAPTPGVK